jgi:hypothetical protein
VLKIDQVKEIVAENKLKKKVSSLEDFALEIVSEPEKDFNNAMGQESLTRFDQPKKKKKPNRNNKRPGENAIVANNNNNKPPQQKNQGKPFGNNKIRPKENAIKPNIKNEPKK